MAEARGKRLWRNRCERRGHDWFPGLAAREFVPVRDVCLRCPETRTTLPWGECLSGHALADHYSEDGAVARAVAGCAGPS